MTRTLLFLLFTLPALPQSLDTGKRIFESQCALCHGPDGSGGRGPSLRKAKLKSAPDDDALKRAISEGIPPEMPGAWQLHPREVDATAAYVRSLGKIAIEEIPGLPAAGQALFTKYGCNNCHIVNGAGNARGPELSAIGARRNARHLRESITNPAAFLPDNFLLIEATTAAGRVIKGVKANEDVFTLQLLTPAGRYESIDKASAKSINKLTGQSSMPAFPAMPAADLDNLVAYLASLRGAQ